MSTASAMREPTVDFIIHLPTTIQEADREGVSRALNEAFSALEQLDEHGELVLRRLGLDPSQKGHLQVRVNEVNDQKLSEFVKGLRSVDGRQMLFVTVRLPKDISLSEADFGIAMQSFMGRAGGNTSSGSVLGRLSAGTRKTLERYGLSEAKVGGIQVLLDPSVHDSSFLKTFLDRTGLQKSAFATSEERVH